MLRTRRSALAAIAGLAAAVAIPMSAVAQPSPPAPTARSAQFAAAAREFGVPADLLAAVSYQESRWDAHGGRPSTSGTYGPMGLSDVPASALADRGDGLARPTAHTAATAAKLIGRPVAAVKSDAATNIRAGAALLASYHSGSSSDLASWYPAVTRYGADADAVFAQLRTGAAATSDGGPVAIAAHPGLVTPTAAAKPSAPAAECPRSLGCDFVPAGYALDDPNDLGNYGNYDMADRPHNVKVTTIVMHDTESSYSSTVNEFANPAAYVSAHYVVRSADGHVTQMVPTKDVAWHAGNWYVNMHSIGIEQEGYAIAGASWYTEALYRSSAALVRYLAAKYDVPLDRQHIIGHDNVPGITPAYIPGMHWDPGPYWDWAHFMALLGAPLHRTGVSGRIVTIDPNFVGNLQSVTDCEGDGSATPAQGAGFVWLHTAPSDDAPLFDDPGLWPAGNGGTTCGNDWGDKASTGQQFVVADRTPGWVAIWWDGAKVWLHDDVVAARGFMVVPKAGVTSVATYGRAYPEASAYPADGSIPVQSVVPLPYTITPGQGYVFGGQVPTDYYYSFSFDGSFPNDRTDVRGTTAYYEIQLGHRIAYVQAADVKLVPVN